MLTYQDYLTETDREAFLLRLAQAHEAEETTKTARLADLYDRRRNATVNEYAKKVYSPGGEAFVMYFSAQGSRLLFKL